MRKPVTIITGFLGAGKTTYLSHLLASRSETRFAVIVNEFGEMGIDSELINSEQNDIIELNNGSLCCTLSSNIYDILNQLSSRSYEFDEIIIEATGVANPIGLATPFISHPLIKVHFPLKSITCLVDSELIEDQLQNILETMDQIVFSDYIIINKTDLVESAYPQFLKQKLHHLNPSATIHLAGQCEFPEYDSYVDLKRLKKYISRNQTRPLPRIREKCFPVRRRIVHFEHEHTLGVETHTLYFDRPFDRELLYHHLYIFLKFQSEEMYRLKGVLRIEDTESPCIIQSVGKRLSIDDHCFNSNSSMQHSYIVFVGRNLDRDRLQYLMEKCLVESEPSILEEKTMVYEFI